MPMCSHKQRFNVEYIASLMLGHACRVHGHASSSQNSRALSPIACDTNKLFKKLILSFRARISAPLLVDPNLFSRENACASVAVGSCMRLTPQKSFVSCSSRIGSLEGIAAALVKGNILYTRSLGNDISLTTSSGMSSASLPPLATQQPSANIRYWHGFAL